MLEDDKIILSDEQYKKYKEIMDDPNNDEPTWFVLMYRILGDESDLARSYQIIQELSR